MKGIWRLLGTSALELAAYVPASMVALAALVALGDGWWASSILVLMALLAPTSALLVLDGMRPYRAFALAAVRAYAEIAVLWLALGRTVAPLPVEVIRALRDQGFGSATMEDALAPVVAPLAAAFFLVCLAALCVCHIRSGYDSDEGVMVNLEPRRRGHGSPLVSDDGRC